MEAVIWAMYLGIFLCALRGFLWFFGFGLEERRKNWSCEQSMKKDPRYREYFK